MFILGDSNSISIKLDGLENLSKPGSRLSDVLDQLKDIANSRAVIIAIGVNDSAKISNIQSRGEIRPNLSSFNQTYREMLELAKSKFNKVICIGLVSSTEEEVILDDVKIQYKKSEIKKLNQKIKELCKEFGVEFIDLLPHFLGNEKELLADHIHPNKKGREIIQKELETRLGQL